MKGVSYTNSENNGVRIIKYKAKCPNPRPGAIAIHYKGIVHDTETYYKVGDGSVFKIRERIISRENKAAITTSVIRQKITGDTRPHFYTCHEYLIEDPHSFFKVFDGILVEDIVVKRSRSVYSFDNINVHLDIVEGLDEPYIEIEMPAVGDMEKSKAVLENLQKTLGIDDANWTLLSYKQLLEQKKAGEVKMQSPQFSFSSSLFDC